MNSERNTIGRRDLLRVFLRSLLIQASWSFHLLQSIGFAYALLPILRKLYPDRTEYASRLNLHTEYFNTQPYLASFILGAVVKLEEERAIRDVLRFLTEQNQVDRRRVSAVGMSQYHPVVPNTTRENKTQNRRVEIIFKPE